MPIQTVGQPPFGEVLAGSEAQMCVKTGYVKGDDIVATKVAGGGGNCPANTGIVMVFSQKTFRCETILMDECILTEIRTAAASCLVSRMMMPQTLGKDFFKNNIFFTLIVFKVF